MFSNKEETAVCITFKQNEKPHHISLKAATMPLSQLGSQQKILQEQSFLGFYPYVQPKRDLRRR